MGKFKFAPEFRNRDEKAQPTGGEWVAYGSHVCVGDDRIAFTDNDVSAAFIDGQKHPIGPREARANATLMAAAKELLKACEAARPIIKARADLMHERGLAYDEAKLVAVLVDLDAAIAKARGT